MMRHLQLIAAQISALFRGMRFDLMQLEVKRDLGRKEEKSDLEHCMFYIRIVTKEIFAAWSITRSNSPFPNPLDTVSHLQRKKYVSPSCLMPHSHSLNALLFPSPTHQLPHGNRYHDDIGTTGSLM